MKTRKPKFAGSWYSNDAGSLAAEIDGYLASVKYLGLNVKAIVVPHAGYMFSGKTAAHAFKQISTDTKKVIILGTAHRYYLKGACAIDYDYYDSPLRRVKVSDDVKEVLKEEDVFNINEADTDEHSIEIEIPFLQRRLKDFEILPVIVGRTDPHKFSMLLEKHLSEDAVIVVSVDLSHFHGYNEAVKLDNFSIRSVLELNSENIKNAEIDSPYAVEAVIELAKRKNWQTKLLDYKNSGDIIKDRSSVVGYSAIIFYEEEKKGTFTNEENLEMKNIAKETVETYVRTGKRIKDKTLSPKFDSRFACFVTIKAGDELRGCIGTIEPVDALYNSIIDNAIAAASRDPRFEAVAEEELRGLIYEVSVLSAPEQFEPHSAEELLKSIKSKGVIIRKDFRSAVYLPQVWENFRAEDAFLSSLCRKAGFSGEEWKNYKSMKFYLFRLLN